jgi:hypothetical protein
MYFFIIAYIVYAVKHTSDIRNQKKLIIEKGINEDLFDIYIIGVWFYLIPPLIELFLKFAQKQFYIPPIIIAVHLPILAAFYLPAVIVGLKIYNKFNRGFDYERQIGNKINLTLWIGYVAITLFVGIWLISILISLF